MDRKTKYFYAGSHLLWIVLPIVLASLQITLLGIESKLAKIDAFLLNYLWVGVGLQAFLTGISQIFYGEKSADYLGWSYSPFTKELGYANLAFGVLGLLCLIIKGTWWAATGIGYSIFLLCAAWGHVYDRVVNKNYSLGNIGPTLWSDLLIPFALLMLLSWHYGTLLEKILVR